MWCFDGFGGLAGARAAKGDRMVKLACGPRLMWPNSLILESLLKLGYEAHERIQRALPWIIENQNPDGSWGESDKDIATLAVLKALLRINYRVS